MRPSSLVRIGASVVLGNGVDFLFGEIAQGFNHEGGTHRGEAGGKGFGRVVGGDGQFALGKDVSGVEAGVDAHDRDTSHRFALGNGPLDGGSTAILGEQRGVQVEIAEPREIDHPLRNDAAVADDDDGVRGERGECGLELGVPLDLLGLNDGETSIESALLDGRGGQGHASAAWLIGLGDDQREAMTGVHESLQRGDGEPRGAGEDEVEGGHGLMVGRWSFVVGRWSLGVGGWGSRGSLWRWVVRAFNRRGRQGFAKGAKVAEAFNRRGRQGFAKGAKVAEAFNRRGCQGFAKGAKVAEAFNRRGRKGLAKGAKGWAQFGVGRRSLRWRDRAGQSQALRNRGGFEWARLVGMRSIRFAVEVSRHFQMAHRARRGKPRLYHSPAFISLRILRFIRSRLRALMWLT